MKRFWKTVTEQAMDSLEKNIYLLNDFLLFLNYFRAKMYYNLIKNTPRNLNFNN